MSAIVEVAPNVFELPDDLARTIAHDTVMITAHARFARGGRGMEIVAIDGDSVLAVAGLRVGDTIVDVDGQAIDWDEDTLAHEAFTIYYHAWRKQLPVTIHVWRGGKTIALVYQLPRKT